MWVNTWADRQKRPWCWERSKVGGEGEDRGWDSWMASPTQWTWVWVNSRSWWWTGRPGVLQSMGFQRVGHDWATELNWKWLYYFAFQTAEISWLLTESSCCSNSLVVMYGCESWTIKKAERRRIDAFELWSWRILLRVPWTARRSNQSILKEISYECQWKDWCWSWNSNTLATWCKELIHWKRPWWWERLKAGGEGNDRGWDGWMTSPTRWTWVWVSSGSWWWTGRPGVLQSMGLRRVRHDWVTELNWCNIPLCIE